MKRIKFFQQIEHSDCGIACIRMIAHFYGKNIPIKTLREICDMSRIGITVNDIVRCTKEIGFLSYALKITKNEILRMPLPAILYWSQKHFVVLYKIDIKRGKYYIIDPSKGKISLKHEEFMQHWCTAGDFGVAVALEPDNDFYERNFPNISKRCGLLNLTKDTISKNKKHFSLVFLLLLLAMAADVFLPLLLQQTIDEGINGKNLHLVWMLILGQFGVFLGNFLANALNEIILTKTSLNISISLVNSYLSKLIRLPISFFEKRVKSDLIQKLDDQHRIKDFLVRLPESTLFTIANLLVFSAMMIYYNVWIYCVFIMMTILGIMWMLFFLKKRKALDYSFFSLSSANRNNVYELINGMAEIKINNAQDNRIDIWNKTQRKINSVTLNQTLIDLYMRSGRTMLFGLKDITITGLCATFVINDMMTFGVMMTISYISGRLSIPFSNLLNMINTFQDVSVSYERISDVQEQEDEVKTVNLNGFKDNILFENVSFKYPGSFSPYVIKELNVKIPAGKTTAIVGVSGCGKTTMIKLLLGFYKPQQGRIVLNTSKDEISNIANWLEYCGAVMQDGCIFTGTILENIALADSEPDEAKAANAAQIACLHDFIKGLPMGYKTKVGVSGVELSGGQKQRLLIARAIYKNPQILFLDEATSSLDANNERCIVEKLKEYTTGRTVIIAAHRLSTVRQADKILYMESGEIVEEGTHDELVALKGGYYSLVKNQLELGINN